MSTTVPVQGTSKTVTLPNSMATHSEGTEKEQSLGTGAKDGGLTLEASCVGFRLQKTH